MDFLGGSDSKESACNVGNLGSIPGLGRSPGEGYGNPLQYSCRENPHGQRILEGCSPWGRKESDTTEGLSTAQDHCIIFPEWTVISFPPMEKHSSFSHLVHVYFVNACDVQASSKFYKDTVVTGIDREASYPLGDCHLPGWERKTCL